MAMVINTGGDDACGALLRGLAANAPEGRDGDAMIVIRLRNNEAVSATIAAASNSRYVPAFSLAAACDYVRGQLLAMVDGGGPSICGPDRGPMVTVISMAPGTHGR